jgi:hypothetical protein
VIILTPTANSASFWTRKPSLVHSYRKEFEFATVPNWDGVGAALTEAVIDLADHLICRYASGRHLVEVSPTLDGALSFLWDDDNGNYVYMSVGPNDTVHLYYDVVGLSKWEGVSVASDGQIRAEMERAFRFLHQIRQSDLYFPLRPIPQSDPYFPLTISTFSIFNCDILAA